MKTAVVTDTNSAISVEEGKRFGIYVLPMPVMIDGETFFEGKDLDYDRLWSAFEENRTISTSMPSVGDLMELWNYVLDEEGYEGLVYLPMSSGLSGSCHTAKALAAEYGGRVQVVDNHRISYTLMNSVFDALEMAKRGMDAAAIREELERGAMESSIYITVNSLRYLVKSGRVTEGAARIGDILHLKPVLQIQGSKLDAYAKARGMNNAIDKMISAIRNDLGQRFAGIPKEELSLGTAGTLRTQEEQETWRKRIEQEFPGFRVLYRPLSCSIACHVGTDAIGTAVTRIHYDQSEYSL